MFMGTERVPTGVFDERMESVGGSNNAWTSEDRTNYHDVAPSHAWPLLLWLEADRFEAVGRTMTAEKLETQRKIVRNERRQRTENEPYGKVDLRLSELLYPPTHPYHHPVIGSHEDLEAATVDDVKRFFSDWYAPNNLALVVAGDVPAAEVKSRVEALFGGLPRTDIPAAPAAPPTTLSGVVRETIEDNVELGKIVMAWHSPAHFAPGDAELDLVASILDRGKTSRLHKALVHEGELAQSVSAMQHSQELSSVFAIELVARPGVSLDALERAADDVVKKLVAEGVTAAELDRAKTEYETTFVRSLESVATRASLLNLYETSFGDPGVLERDLARYRRATPSDVAAAAKATLDPNARVVIRVVPRAKPAKEVSP
jgi:predicted Zn-dependent peptidase